MRSVTPGRWDRSCGDASVQGRRRRALPGVIDSQTVMSATGSLSRTRISGSCDEVRLVCDAGRLASADADEDALVQPVPLRGSCLDLGCGTKGVLAGVDVLTSPEAGQDLRAAVAHSA